MFMGKKRKAVMLGVNVFLVLALKHPLSPLISGN